MKIVFWQSYLAFHQAAYIRELSETPGFDVYWAVSEALPDHLRRMGYPLPNVGRAKVVVNPSDLEMDKLLAPDCVQTVHVFLCFRGMALSAKAFHRSKRWDVLRIVMSENRYEAGWKLFPRWCVYVYDAAMQRKWIDGLLCIGFLGPRGGRNWFRFCGYADKKIFPFLYPIDAYADESSLPIKMKLNLIFVGQLIRRKGLDVLLQALARIKDIPWHLSVIGSGPENSALQSMVKKFGLNRNIVFLENMENKKVSTRISDSGILVLPSRFDGWGAVVSEAMVAGTPVICSDRCGASDIVAGSGFGYVFRSGDVKDLESGIRLTYSQMNQIDLRDRLKLWSSRIQGKFAAQYFLEVVLHLRDGGPRPQAFWLLR